MDLQRKLELLVKYDFSAWRNNFDPKNRSPISFLQGILISLGFLELGFNNQKNNGMLNENSLGLIALYSQINFEELDKSDGDFKFLFDYFDKIKFLKQKVDKISKLSMNHENYMLEVEDAINYILKDIKSMNYREQVLAKYGLKYSYSI